MLKKTRTYAPREMRLVSEYIAKTYPGESFKMNVRLGSLHPRLQGRFLSEAEQRMVGVFRRYADGLIFLQNEVILIEAAIRPQPGKISILELYKRLIPMTPDLAEIKDKPVRMVLLCAIDDPVMTQLAREKGIEVVMFRPQWVDEYIETLYPREQTATLTSLE